MAFSAPEDEFLDQVMESEDKDKDGQVTWEEFSGPKGDEPIAAAKKDEL